MRTKTIHIEKSRRITLRQVLIATTIILTFFCSIVYLDMKERYSAIYASSNIPGLEDLHNDIKIQTPDSPRTVAEIKVDRSMGYKNYIASMHLTDSNLEKWLLDVIWCESRGNPKAVNSQHVIVGGVDYGPATGLGQFLVSSWERGEKKFLKREADIWNEYDQVDMMIAFYQAGQKHEWACTAIVDK